jgi:hypothetical protein
VSTYTRETMPVVCHARASECVDHVQFVEAADTRRAFNNLRHHAGICVLTFAVCLVQQVGLGYMYSRLACNNGHHLVVYRPCHTAKIPGFLGVECWVLLPSLFSVA